jgi:hypothetical protein
MRCLYVLGSYAKSGSLAIGETTWQPTFIGIVFLYELPERVISATSFHYVRFFNTLPPPNYMSPSHLEIQSPRTLISA